MKVAESLIVSNNVRKEGGWEILNIAKNYEWYDMEASIDGIISNCSRDFVVVPPSFLFLRCRWWAGTWNVVEYKECRYRTLTCIVDFVFITPYMWRAVLVYQPYWTLGANFSRMRGVDEEDTLCKLIAREEKNRNIKTTVSISWILHGM
jgi:hypothetical protein